MHQRVRSKSDETHPLLDDVLHQGRPLRLTWQRLKVALRRQRLPGFHAKRSYGAGIPQVLPLRNVGIEQ